ncbi:TetR/AcrR family transcriptional regulator [Planococcus lenghuensis]|uniref:TetR family transcriptional regulator n=1 Tax=Planococcus lenghuensis TaxID=2213202 RepID=A0A1Q2L2N1_9BACL|nr:TetR/AcrR family transcriptional regulator [Planococcus lenghuensis]AQQ54718.1 TetR family transcriptional regulator [Planococcus lenghuensis]
MNLRERKAAKKREDILRSASLVIAREGFQNATMEDIAAELLMTKGSLYYYFNSKQELLYHCHDWILSDAMEKMEEIVAKPISAVEKLKQAIKMHLQVAIQEKDVFNLIIKPAQVFPEEYVQTILIKRDKYAEYFDKIIEQGMEMGEFAPKHAKMVRMIILGATNWVQVWYSPGGEFSKEEIQDMYAEYLTEILI